MVIVASGMVRWRVRLATTFGTQPTASSLQQSTVFAEEEVLSFCVIQSVLEEKCSSYKFSSIFGGT